MYRKVYSNPDVFSIEVPLPDNPLKNLNCYVIVTKDRNLMIDTGFNRKECLAALLTGIKELGIDLNNTDLFLSHLHSDHTGLAKSFMPEGAKIYMSRVDNDYWNNRACIPGRWERLEEYYNKEGFPWDEIYYLREHNPARAFAVKGRIEAIQLDDGDEIAVGDVKLKAILTPGHTPGHMCLYMEKEKILFSADHILFDITPNITWWEGMDDSLGAYIESLKKIKQLDVETVFPAHRGMIGGFYERVEALLKHHEARIENTRQIIADHVGLTANEISAGMKWQMRGKSWDTFPPEQKWFAIGETIAHLDYMRMRGEADREFKDGCYRYHLINNTEK